MRVGLRGAGWVQPRGWSRSAICPSGPQPGQGCLKHTSICGIHTSLQGHV